MAIVLGMMTKKGGAGKSTLTKLLASAVVFSGHKCLVIDLDPNEDILTWWTSATEQGNHDDRLTVRATLNSEDLFELVDEHDEKGTGSIEVLTSNNRVMKRYEFYRNQKITVIDCRYFSIEAENLETAVQKIKDLCADGQLDELSNDPTHQEDAAYQIPGTEYPLDIENNNGDPTVMIYSAADGNCITDNLPKRSIKCLSMPARRGGTDNSQRSKSESGKSLPNEYPEQTRSALRTPT